MADNGTEMRNARQQELDYETHVAQLRQRIVQLITSYAEIEEEAEDLRPARDDDQQRLDLLENRIRNNITALQQLSAQYVQAVAEWDQLDLHHGIMTSDSPWTRSMHAFRKKCLNAKSNRPALQIKVDRLILSFDGMLTAIIEIREDSEPNARAVQLLSPNPGYIVQSPPSTAGSGAPPSGALVTQRRVQFASPTHPVGTVNPLGRPTHPIGIPIVIPPPASSEPDNQLAFYNPLRAFELARRYLPSFGFGLAPQTPPTHSPPTQAQSTPASASSFRSNSISAQVTPSSVHSPRPIPKPRTAFRRPATEVPIVTQLDFGDTTPDARDNRRWQPMHSPSSAGVMSSADPLNGSIHNTRSMEWERTFRSMHEDRAPRGTHFFSTFSLFHNLLVLCLDCTLPN